MIKRAEGMLDGRGKMCVCVCWRLIKLIKCVKLTALFAKCSPDAGKWDFPTPSRLVFSFSRLSSIWKR